LPREELAEAVRCEVVDAARALWEHIVTERPGLPAARRGSALAEALGHGFDEWPDQVVQKALLAS
jgi:hypothetical protein